MEELCEEKWYQRGQKAAFMGKTTRWHHYQNRVVQVTLNKTHLVPVPNIVVPVPQCPKAQIFVIRIVTPKFVHR